MKYFLIILLFVVSNSMFSQNLEDFEQIDKFKTNGLTVKVFFKDPLREIVKNDPSFNAKEDKEKHSILSGYLHNNQLFVFQTYKKKDIVKTYILRGNPNKVKGSNFYNLDIVNNFNEFEKSIDKLEVGGSFFEHMELFRSKDGGKLIGKFTKIWGYFTNVVPYQNVKQPIIEIIEMDINNEIPIAIIEKKQDFIKPLFEYQKFGLQHIEKRTLTINVCRYDKQGNLVNKRPRTEVDTSIYLTSISKDLNSVTSFPYFAETDSIHKERNKIYVQSRQENINHYLKDIEITTDSLTGQISKIEGILIIHSYSKEGHDTYNERYIAEFADVNGCYLPKIIKYCWIDDLEYLRPRIITEINYELK